MLGAGVGVGDASSCRRLVDLVRNPLCVPQHVKADEQVGGGEKMGVMASVSE